MKKSVSTVPPAVLVFCVIAVTLLSLYITSGPRPLFAAGTVVVAARTLSIGDTISYRDVYLKDMAKRDRPDYEHDIKSVIGKRVKRPIGINNIVKRSYLKDGAIISRGDIVALVAGVGNLRVMTKAVALSFGEAGGVIEVKNISSGKIIEARVLKAGMVGVSF